MSDMFDYFAKILNPQLSRISEIFKTGYYWCLDQCEYATDIMFKCREDLLNIYPEFKIYKEVTRKGKKTKEWVTMGKSIANLYRYAQVSLAANKRYIEALSMAGFNLLSSETTDIFSCVMSAGNFINGFTNQTLRIALFKDSVDNKKQEIKLLGFFQNFVLIKLLRRFLIPLNIQLQNWELKFYPVFFKLNRLNYLNF